MSTISSMTGRLQQLTAPPSNQGHLVGGHLTDQPEPFKRLAFINAQFEGEPGPSPATFRWSFGRGQSAMLTAIDLLTRGLADYQSPVKYEGAAQAAIEPSNLSVPPNIPLSGLEEVYVFEERARVAEFVERNRLRSLLVEARDPLVAAFGERAVKKLSLVEDDEGSETLFCSVGVSGSLNDARRALRSFDQGWWLAHCANVSGKLNFDFELV